MSDGVELRRYGPRIAAETTVAADEDRARNVGFRRLANYIFGANHRDETIAMTAPVAQQSDRRGDDIAMTAPVSPVARAATTVGPSGSSCRRSGRWTLSRRPTTTRSALVTVPGETVAVLRFSGDRGPAAVAARTEELVEVLRDKGIDAAGEPVAWFYDPPWTLPFRRRNEIAIPVEN